MTGLRSISTRDDRRRLLGLIALLLALGEIADAYFISFPAAAFIVAALFLAGAFWTSRGGLGGPTFVAALCALEIAGLPFYERHGTGDWLTQIAFGVVSLGGLLLAVATIKPSLDQRNAQTAQGQNAATRATQAGSRT